MNQIVVRQFLSAWDSFQIQLIIASSNRGRKATKDENDTLIKALDDLRYHCNRMGFWQSLKRCKLLIDRLADFAPHRIAQLESPYRKSYAMPKEVPLPDFESVFWELQNLDQEIKTEMDAVRLAVIFKEKVGYFENDALFGPQFHQAASAEINAEIKAAGNCLAAEMNTAAVFHLMRAVEHGVRCLAKERPAINLNLPGNRPIEFATWRMVLKAIDREIQALEPDQVKNAKEIEFLSQITTEIRAFQHAWRDPVMHARFEEPQEAENIFEHVKRFMKWLISNISLK